MALLEATEVSVSFGGVKALSNVSVQVEEGTVAALIGPNGAGKSTFLAVLSGLIQPQHGQIRFDGRDIGRLAPHGRARLGISRSFQRLELWGSMTVRENITTAAEFASRWRKGTKPDKIASDLIDQLALGVVADTMASALPSGIARVTEVARALASSPRLLLLDEPSAGLDDFESRELADALIDVAGRGTAVLLVEHHIEMVMRVSAEIWVLDFGILIDNGSPEEIRKSAAVQAAYLGSASDASA
jgi:branched-chain amino acid transport system ATP-binding protein